MRTVWGNPSSPSQPITTSRIERDTWGAAKPIPGSSSIVSIRLSMNCCRSYVRMSRGSILAAIWRKTGLPSFAIGSLGMDFTYHPFIFLSSTIQAMRREGGLTKYNTRFFSLARHGMATREGQDLRDEGDGRNKGGESNLSTSRASRVSRSPASGLVNEHAQAVSDPTFRSYPSGRSTIPTTRSSTLDGLVWSTSPNRETPFHVGSESRATAPLRVRQNVPHRQSSRSEPVSLSSL